eukprot:CAMPEP_0119341670 /NCGR_PEP_ID=MMETSP1333-20130426/102962_1 /TAXON_ID=418940 /ORGANISM="Scyphosphaera apsteinii, Strain RCC1455" /LENGTH=65 /DNA_ID=CAMNT_0007353707 /DNA_START=22 /DNA_END=216 /DNA_ORIENTATION=+
MQPIPFAEGIHGGVIEPNRDLPLLKVVDQFQKEQEGWKGDQQGVASTPCAFRGDSNSSVGSQQAE